MPDFVGQFGTGLGMLIENRQCRCAAGTEFVPCLFGGRQGVTQTAQGHFLGQVGFLVDRACRYQRAQVEHRLNFGHQHFPFHPDVIVGGKGLGGGYVPLGRSPDPHAYDALTPIDAATSSAAYQAVSATRGLRSEYGASSFGAFLQVGVYVP